MGVWGHYGLGSVNDNLPQFVVLGEPIDTCCGGVASHGAAYLGPEHGGVQLEVRPENPLPYSTRGLGVSKEEQKSEFELLSEFNKVSAIEYPDDAAMRARIKSYELAFRMQTAGPDVMRFSEQNEATRRLYGLDHEVTRPFGEMCLAARRLAESGVHFVQVFHGQNGGAGKWGAPSHLQKGHTQLCPTEGKQIAGLLADV